MQSLTAFNLMKWIDAHRDALRPPVCNQQVFEDDDFIVMVVGGPNARDDYHIDEGPEFFYQIEGDMLLRTISDGTRRDIRIAEGDVLLLPPCVPHSPQRFADTIGLVIERKRLDHELDHLRWYCESCGEIVHDESFHCVNLGTQLKPVIEAFAADESLRTCGRCGAVMKVDA